MDDFNFEDYNLRFSGIARLYGLQGLKNLLHAHVLIVGLGGVGSWAAEALARSGVGAITLVDMDDICISNTNRQLPAIDGNFGKMKVAALKERIKLINPQCKVTAIEEFFTESTASFILSNNYNYVIDAIDSLQNKCVLAVHCKEMKLPLIIAGGTAGKKDPTRIKVDDLGRACNDSLLYQVRKRLRQKFDFPSGEGCTRSNKQIFNFACAYSDENSVYPQADGSICNKPDPKTNLKLDCQTGMGSITHVTATFGFACAGYVIDQIAQA